MFVCFYLWFVDYYELYGKSSIAAKIETENLKTSINQKKVFPCYLECKKLNKKTDNNLSWKRNKNNKRKNEGFIIWCVLCTVCKNLISTKTNDNSQNNHIKYLSFQIWATLFVILLPSFSRWCFAIAGIWMEFRSQFSYNICCHLLPFHF